jgi:putative ABC transport system permease protein
MNILKLSWKNLIGKPLNMALSLILFALGVGLVSILFLLNDQVQEKFDKNLAGIDMVIGAKGSPLQMILCSMYHIDVPTGNIKIKEAAPFMREGHPLIETAIPLSIGDSYQGYRIVGTTEELVDLYEGELAEGDLWKKDFEVTIGASVANDRNLKIGDTFKSSHGFVHDDGLEHDDAQSFKVVGVFKPSGAVLDQLILSTTASIWKVHDAHAGEEHDHEEDHQHAEDDHDHADHEGHDHEGHDHEEPALEETPVALIEQGDQEITSLLVKFKNRNFQTLNMPRNINENTDLMAAVPAIEINQVYSQLGVGMDALQALAYIIVIVSGLSIFISLFSSLKNRQYELALIRVMGASPAALFVLIVLEGLLLAIIGYILGIALSHIGMSVLAGFMQESYRYSFSGSVFMIQEIYILIGALAVGFLAAVIPAIIASRTDISTTLSKAG